jgi:hypothetical protein
MNVGEELMQSTSEKSGKRPYTTPRLTVHGTLEDVTQQQNKTYGLSDGYLFQGISITNVS